MPTIPYVNAAGKRLCGSTTILGNIGWNKQALQYWAWNLGMQGINYRDAVKGAADAGTCGHYLVDCYIRKIKPDKSTFLPEVLEKGEQAFVNFLKWAKAVRFKSLYTEVNLVSERYQFGGTPDCVGTIGKELSLIDWKTGNGVYADMLMQLYSYKVLWEENKPDEPLVGGVHLVRFTKESASFHHHHWAWADLANAGVWDAFQAALTLHNTKKKLEGLL